MIVVVGGGDKGSQKADIEAAKADWFVLKEKHNG